MEFHHIGVACNNLEETKNWVKRSFPICEEQGPIFDQLQNASFITLKMKDGFLIELISGGQVATFLKKGINLYHVCYEVEDLENTIENLKKNGAIVISKPKPAVLLNNRRIAFLNTPLGIIELLERKSGDGK